MKKRNFSKNRLALTFETFAKQCLEALTNCQVALAARCNMCGFGKKNPTLGLTTYIIILLIFFQSIEDRLKAINAEAAETSRYFPH